MDNNTGSRAYMESILNGQTPAERQSPQLGQSKYYYYKPNQREDISVSDMETVDVPTADTPNPFLSESTSNLNTSSVQKDNKQIFGNTVSPMQAQNNKGFLEQFGNNLGNIARKTGIDKLTENIYNLGYDAVERLTYPQSNVQNYENKSSLAKALAEAQRLAPIKVSDVNKHQYVSCIGAFDGPISAGATAAAGLYKEGGDLYKKWNNPKYGTNWQILQDSFKDLKNDAIGISRGWSANDINACNDLLPLNVRRR